MTNSDKQAVVLGLDVGTSGVRATLFDETGDELSGASVRTLRTFSGPADFSTIDPQSLVKLVEESIDQLLAQTRVSSSSIELISISCFWHTLIGIDDERNPTTPVLGWADTRAADSAKELRATLDEAATHARTGCRFHPSYWPAKLLWLRSSEDEASERTTRWLSFSEYLTLRLFDYGKISVSMASGTGLMNQRSCSWDRMLLNELNIPNESLPEIAADGVTDSTLTQAYARRWPQLATARLFPPIADGAANNVGAGCTTRGQLALMIGTSGAMRVLYEGEPPERLPAGLWSYRADRKRVVVGGALSDGGGLYRWISDAFLSDENSKDIEATLRDLPADAHGLTILPFWAGERSPGWSLNATGAIFGLSLETKPIEILRAGMEAVAYRFALILKALDEINPGATIIAAGNALQQSPVWLQIIADVLGRPVTLSSTREASSRGAALLALEAAGKIQRIEITRGKNEGVTEPNSIRHAVYQEAAERQQRAYNAMIAAAE